MTRFHDSRFQGVRLVCRLRRSSGAPVSGVPTGPAALVPTVAQSQTAFEAIAQNRKVSSQAEELAMAGSSREGEGSAKVTDKYFIMKSLTVEDMELSVRNGIWATQAHNEEALNKAFEVGDPNNSNRLELKPDRLPRTSTLSFRRTSRESISALREWLPPSVKQQHRALTGLPE